ncbi:MAG: hypothetical protein JNM55_07095 [Anaerolineales bacterium]|nr:hypothetical protein [Anaerolineales bacterium]
MLGLDQVLVNMISIIIGGVGLIGAITKFDVANSKKSFYGENPFASKEEIINASIVQWFTAYTAAGLIFQVVFGLIFGDLIPDRSYPRFVYVTVLVFGIPYSYLLIRLLRRMGTKFSEGKWQSDIVNRFRDHYESVEFIIENDGRSKDDGETISENTKNSNYKTAEKIIDRLEELFDLSPSGGDNIAVRAKRFKKYFKI